MGPLAYLADLAQFGLTHIRVKNAEWSLAEMCTYLGQPIKDLAVTCDAVSAQVRQVRLAVEVLRRHLTKLQLTKEENEQIGAAEQRHCRDAYVALLLQVGTTLEEVRLARAAGSQPTYRNSLASRLGIRAEKLDEFWLDWATLTEPELEKLFGFIDTDITHRDPLAPATTPKLLTWREEYLSQFWSVQDRPDDRPRPWYDDPDPARGARPLIDPDLLGIGDFCHSKPDDAAFAIFVKRRNEIEDKVAEIRRAPNFDQAFAAVYPDPLPDLDRLKADLQDTAKSAAALRRVREILRLTPEAFLRLLKLRDEIDAERASPDERDEAADILAWAAKAAKFADWIKEESEVHDLWSFEHFWIALQDTILRRWRGSAEARAEWQQALRVRMRPPLIDPDLLQCASGVDDVGGGADNFELLDEDRAYGLYLKRRRDLRVRAEELHGLWARWNRRGKPQAHYLDNTVREGLGVKVHDLTALDELRRSGQSAEARLNQLGLTVAAFNRLLRLADLAKAGPLLEPDWKEVEEILVQVWKVRQFGAWRDEEAERNVVLGPDEFRIVTPPRSPCGKPQSPGGANRVAWPPLVPSADRTPFQRWRAPEEDYRAWQDRLQTRIDQRTTLAQALMDAVSTAERAVLPKLRDALIEVIPIEGIPPSETKANFLAR
jgi:hypothetical protein